MKKYDKKRILVNYDYKLAPFTTAYYFERVLRHHRHYRGYRLGELDPDAADAILNFETCDGVIASRGIPSAYYEIDNHLIRGLENWNYDPVDFVFIAQKFNLELYPLGKTHYLPLAADPDLHKPFPEMTETYDIGFIGNPNYMRRKRLLEKLAKNHNCLITNSEPGLPYSQKLSKCKVLFNCSLENDVNMRFFESMSIGKPLVSDYLPAQDEFAVDRVHYFAYRNDNELIKSCNELLRSAPRRKSTGDIARFNIKKNHTYKHRVEQMLKIMGV
jgi:hypothetical protein